MTHRIPGRHRRPGRLAATTTLTRSAAVAATATGLLAGTAVTAGAEPSTQDHPAKGAEALVRLGLAVQEDPTLVVDRPAQAAPAPESSPDNFGTTGFTAFTPVVEEVVEEVAAPVETQQAAPAQVETQQVETQQAAPAPVETQASAAVEDRTQTTASRTEVRAAPVAPAPEPAPEPAPPANGSITSIAASLMGIPYVYGGGTPAGFDCSGFTSYVYAQAGISLPHNAAAQQQMATPVSNPQPGDLVFFGYPAYHVGIYGGPDMIYDASNPSLPTSYHSISWMWGTVSGYGRVG